MHRSLSVSLVVLCFSCLQGTGVAQSKRPATFEDVMQVKAVGSPTLSPDGTTVLYTVAPSGDSVGFPTALTCITSSNDAGRLLCAKPVPWRHERHRTTSDTDRER